MDIFGITESLSKCIIRPPRAKYSQSDLGPKHFISQNINYQRTDFEITNQYQYKLACSIYRNSLQQNPRPVMIYLHANSSSRLAVRSYLKQLLKLFDVVSFDFAGSGLSQGNYTTLGFYEKEDLKCVIQYLKDQLGIKTIVLWGRSMGAVTAILYSAKYCELEYVQGLVLDSPFSNLVKMLKQLALSYISFLPDMIFESMLENIQDKINQTLMPFYKKHNCKQKFNLHKLCPDECISKIKIPTFFISGREDKLVNYKNTLELYQKIGGNKQLELLAGGHNDFRPEHIKNTIIDYLKSRVKLNHKKNIKSQQVKHSQIDLAIYNKKTKQQDTKNISQLIQKDPTQTHKNSVGILNNQKVSQRKRRIFTDRPYYSENCILSVTTFPEQTTYNNPNISNTQIPSMQNLQVVRKRKKIFLKK